MYIFFVYDADDLMNYFQNQDINTLIIVNPDNPSGNYICRADLLRLIRWTKEREIQLLIDESFVDFADAEEPTIIVQDLLAANPHLFVMKSISKSYGVPGLRLGVLTSGNTEKIAEMKKDVPIWNINSFAEFYMQIAEKYQNNYADALVQIRQERKRFEEKLNEIVGIKAIPSQANYIMIEVTGSLTASELTRRLLFRHNLFVKDLSHKIVRGNRQFIRIAVRNTQDNDKLVYALKAELQ